MKLSKILIFSDWFFPAYKAGGPITSLNNLVKKIEYKVDITILTSAFDLGGSKILDGVAPDQWTNIYNKTKINYLTNFGEVSKELCKNEYNCIYLNSMFSHAFTIRPLLTAKRKGLLNKIILAPRGMLAEGAISLKPFKKKLFLQFFKIFGIHKKILFHATSEQEVKDIKRVFGNEVRIKLIPNTPSEPNKGLNTKTKESENLKLISIARIAQEKNITFLLSLFNNVNFNVTLDIYGMVKTKEYLDECNKIIETLPVNVKVNINGGIHPSLIKDKLNDAHFFILPTLGENFGHAIYEALSSGTPVIISDKTPWRNLENQKAGWDIPLESKEKFIDVLSKCSEMDDNEYQQWSNGAYNYAKKYYEENDPTKKYLTMFGLKEN